MRGIQITDAVKHLLIINIIMFIGTLAIGGGQLLYDLFALHFPVNNSFKPWQILTHMFMHGGPSHILFNMFALWMFGTAVEQVLGTKKFIFFYISAGLGAALIMLGTYYFKYYGGLNTLTEAGISQSQIIETLKSGQYNTQWTNILGEEKLQSFLTVFNSTMVGASGAIMGVLVAFGMMFPESKLMLIFLPIPIKAKYFIPGIIALDLFSALTGQSIFSPSNTAYMAHIGGALTGFLIMKYWKNNQFNDRRWDL
ncbi:MAG: rhomboid family intramembrane serine protease [Bacteroidia bacterium]|nr:rhomboid family intramembrane serine protease [Bacteroidia bacterium]NND11441.1 rhomboid family intramembrane serine protease [Flavobacteriaceae bacterium]MBT8310868.1 rhomboid family intramembrane serine protease [Bacteroidia bacterium]NNK28270.1 rhomboid family intramembrane serine protease [Flavobacteriaceae bacterium]NNL61735.1 rhomboid family intramembrane serine protease [Flavobacteriaceae bacterium]